MKTTSATPWTDWEDWLAGLYSPTFEPEHVAASVALLVDGARFYVTAVEMVRAWPHAAEHNLRHLWTGRNAWLGQASCLYAAGSPSVATRAAWAELSYTQQTAANRVAGEVRKGWERDGFGCQTLLDL